MKFRIQDKEYDARAIQNLTLKQVMEFNRESQELGYDLSWADMEELDARLQKMTPKERAQDPGTLLLLAVTIWSSRLGAGEKIGFGESIDISLSEIEFIFEKGEGPKPIPTKARPQQASGRARKKSRKKDSVSARSSYAKTSGTASTDA